METKLRELKAGEPYYLEILEMEIRDWDPKTRTMVHKVSKEVSDRYRDIVRIAGLDMKNYRKNPVVVYGHDYISKTPVPIMGKNQGFTVEGKRNPTLWAKSQFWKERDVSPPLADLISDWIFLSNQGVGGWSIGFRVFEWDKILDADENWIGYDFKKSELIEYSGVVIPGNQEAVNNALDVAVAVGEINDGRAERIMRLAEVPISDFIPALKSDELWTPSLDTEDEYEAEAGTEDIEDEETKKVEVPVISQSEIEKGDSEALNRIEAADESKDDNTADYLADFIKALSDFTDGLLELRKKHKSFFDKFNQE